MTHLQMYLWIYILGALAIGFPIGVKSFNLLVLDQFEFFGGMGWIWKITLFPLLGWSPRFSEQLPIFNYLCGIKTKKDATTNKRNLYVVVSMLIWPIRVAWNFFGIIVIACRLFGILISD